MRGITISYKTYNRLLEDSRTLKLIRKQALKRQNRYARNLRS